MSIADGLSQMRRTMDKASPRATPDIAESHGAAHAASPLRGIKVLDLTRYVAGPHCSMLLGDFGADVVKVERPGLGDEMRAMEPRWQGESLFMMTLNRNKRSLAMDLYSAPGRELLRRLASVADVLIENFKPGAMEKMGCGWDELNALNPRLVMARISGFGPTGPYADQPAYDVIAQAMGGLMSVAGAPGSPPQTAGTILVDYSTALYTALGIMMALRSRDQSGRGQVVDCTLLDSVTSLLMGWIPEYLLCGKEPARIGSRDRYSAPANVFQCSDGRWIHLVGSTDKQFAGVCIATGRPELATDTRFATIGARIGEVEAIEEFVLAWTKTVTADQALAALQQNDVPCAAVATIAEVVANPQIKHRGQIVEVDHPAGGKVPVQGPPIRLSETPAALERGVPAVGQHTAQVLADWLGCRETEVAELRAAGVVT
jgi:crotonobetainyl-CoA:carnitine CoA-transferase CaiB-like acyl-CoA transferase